MANMNKKIDEIFANIVNNDDKNVNFDTIKELFYSVVENCVEPKKNYESYIGTITTAPDMRVVGEKKTPLCKFAIALPKANENDKNEKTEFIRCQCWSKIAKYFNNASVGTPVEIKGNYLYNNYVDKEGNNKTSKVFQINFGQYIDVIEF